MAWRRIVFTEHALRRMKERHLPRSIIKQAATHPDVFLSSHRKPNRFLFKKLVMHRSVPRLLLVVGEQTNSTLNIITVIATSKIDKYA